MSPLLLVILTAVASSILTCVLLLAALRYFAPSILRDAVERAADDVLPRLRAEVEGAVDSAASRAVPELRDGVGRGVREAAEEVLPRLREEVRGGLQDGLRGAVSPEAVGRAGEELARRGASVLEEGLGLLLGTRRKRSDDVDE